MMETVRGEDCPYRHGYIKACFQLHGVDATETVILRRKLRRTEMLAFFATREPTVIGIEACAGSHYLARTLGELGHEVKLLAAIAGGGNYLFLNEISLLLI